MKFPANTQVSPSFVLGIPRSGTTWLSNILDPAPNTALFLEPFSTIASDVFPKLPATSLFLRNESESLASYFRGDFLKLLADYKTLFKKSNNSTGCFKRERRFCRLMVFLGRKTRLGKSKRCRMFELLNLNRIANDCPLYEKDPEARHWVIKELRAAGKIDSLRSAFPESKFLTIIRHPCATVDSILKWFERGRLVELNSELLCFNEAFRSQTISKQYAELLDKVDRSGHPAAQVALYWRVHYETIVNSLAKHPQNLIVTHEELSSQTPETAEKIFQFLNIEWSEQITEYIQHSTQTKASAASPISTVRSSTDRYDDWCKKIDPEIQGAVEEVVLSSTLMKYFAPYYETRKTIV